MRKRSGALEADSIETYLKVHIFYDFNLKKLKLAIKTAQENIRFPKKSLNSYRNKSFYDYIIPSWSQEQESSYELALDPSGREDFSLTQSKIQEIQSPKQKSLKIMVLSQSHSEKKKFINAICPTHLTENEATNFDLNIANKKEYNSIKNIYYKLILFSYLLKKILNIIQTFALFGFKN